MQLTKNNIQFIDNYLKKAGVHYDDIRYEMTDHVAAAIEDTEGDFDQSFRNYMVNHKKELLDNNRAFKKASFARAFLILKKNLISVRIFITTLIIFVPSFCTIPFLGEDNIKDNLEITMLMVSSFVYFYFLYYKIFSRASHSVIDKLLTIVYFGAIFIRFDKLIKNPTLLLVYYSFIIAFFIMLMQSLYNLNKQYKLRYNE